MSTRSEILNRASVLTEILKVHKDSLSSAHFQFIAELAQTWIDVAGSMPSTVVRE